MKLTWVDLAYQSYQEVKMAADHSFIAVDYTVNGGIKLLYLDAEQSNQEYIKCIYMFKLGELLPPGIGFYDHIGTIRTSGGLVSFFEGPKKP